MIFPDKIQLVNGKPWGHGAVQVQEQKRAWVCDQCNKLQKSRTTMHIYCDGDITCTDCARKWCEVNYVPPVQDVDSQMDLF